MCVCVCVCVCVCACVCDNVIIGGLCGLCILFHNLTDFVFLVVFMCVCVGFFFDRCHNPTLLFLYWSVYEFNIQRKFIIHAVPL